MVLNILKRKKKQIELVIKKQDIVTSENRNIITLLN